MRNQVRNLPPAQMDKGKCKGIPQEIHKGILPEILKEILPEILKEILPEILKEILPEILKEILPEIHKEILPEMHKGISSVIPSGTSKETPSPGPLTRMRNYRMRNPEVPMNPIPTKMSRRRNRAVRITATSRIKYIRNAGTMCSTSNLMG